MRLGQENHQNESYIDHPFLKTFLENAPWTSLPLFSTFSYTPLRRARRCIYIEQIVPLINDFEGVKKNCFSGQSMISVYKNITIKRALSVVMQYHSIHLIVLTNFFVISNKTTSLHFKGFWHVYTAVSLHVEYAVILRGHDHKNRIASKVLGFFSL